ncbi:MAG TPA: hypothetical protein VFW22_10745 [Pseudolabrys sp.]|nr:hypothetical protein [Pseudolabrys sp.]
MRTSNRTATLVLGANLVLSSLPAYAIDLNGAWADNESNCSRIFVKKNNKISIARDSDHYGSGLIFQGNKIRGKIMTCTVTKRVEEAGSLNLIASCSNDVALSTMQFSLKIDGDDKITRVYPGVPELSVSYVRCR